MKISLSQITTMYPDLDTELQMLRASGWRHLEVLFSRIEEYKKTYTLDEIKGKLDKAGITAVGGVGFARQTPGVLLAKGKERDGFFRELEGQLAACKVLGVKCLGLGADQKRFAFDGWQEHAAENLQAAGDLAAGYGVTIGIEFCALEKPCVLDKLAETIALVNAVDHPQIGFIIDFFHFFKNGGTVAELKKADLGRLVNVHLCDLPYRPIEKVEDEDRVLPGEGVLDLDALTGLLLEKGYDGYFCLEMLNPVVWRIPAEERARRCMEAMAGIHPVFADC